MIEHILLWKGADIRQLGFDFDYFHSLNFK